MNSDDVPLLTNVECTQENLIDVGKYFCTSMSFLSKEELIEWAKSIAKNLGFVIIILRADNVLARAKPRVFLCCDRARAYSDSLPKKGFVKKNIRKSSSKRCGCQFTLKGRKEGYNEWKVEVKNGFHNHKFVHLEAHPYIGRLDDDEKKIVAEMCSAGVKPRTILSSLKKRNPENTTTLRTIYNEKAKLYRLQLEGGTPIQYLFKCISESGYISFNQVHPDSNCLESIFFAHPTSVRLSNMFLNVFMIDCTYKTNRYRLPLLCIVGVTSTNQSFFSSFAFMANETEASYTWALQCFKFMFDENVLPTIFVTDREIALMNSIKVVFPQAQSMLCNVHINRNILAHCKKYFKSGKECDKFLGVWQHLVNSPSENEFHFRYNEMLRDYGVKYPNVLAYVTKFADDYKSTKRDLSHFEHVILHEQAQLKTKMIKIAKKFIPTRSGFLEKVRAQMPIHVRPHIVGAIDVMGDGHCGYRVISMALDMSDNWMQVRHDLASEVHKNQILYNEIFGMTKTLELLNALDCWVVPAPLDKWMTLPDMGLMVASCYNIQLVHFSIQQSFNFLPLHSAPNATRKIIYMGYINDNHFIMLRMKEDCTMPTVYPVWTRYHEPQAAE